MRTIIDNRPADDIDTMDREALDEESGGRGERGPRGIGRGRTNELTSFTNETHVDGFIVNRCSIIRCGLIEIHSILSVLDSTGLNIAAKGLENLLDHFTWQL